ncbi:MAG: Kelch repeat-containing protein [Leptospirales bacterium]
MTLPPHRGHPVTTTPIRVSGRILLFQALFIIAACLCAGTASANGAPLPIRGWVPEGSGTVQLYRINTLTGENGKLLEETSPGQSGSFHFRLPEGIPLRLTTTFPSSCMRGEGSSPTYSALILPWTLTKGRNRISLSFQSTARDRMTVFIHSRSPGQKGSWHQALKKANWEMDHIFGPVGIPTRTQTGTGRAEQAVLTFLAGWRGGNSWEWGDALAADLADSKMDGKVGGSTIALCQRPIPAISGTVLWRSAALMVLAENPRILSKMGATRIEHSSHMVGLLAPPPTGKWVTVPEMPTPRDSVLVVSGPNNHPVVIGGEALQGVSNAVESWNPSTHQWVKFPSYPMSVSYAAGTTLPDGRIFVTGGFNSDGFTGSSYMYLPQTHQWIGVSSDPVPRAGSSAVLLPDGSVLVTGGETASGITNLTERFIAQKNRWVKDPDAPEGRLGGISALMPDGRVLVLGGLLKTGGITGEGRYYNTRTHRWEGKSPPAPTSRLYGTGAVMPDGTLFVLDGFNRTGVLQSVDSYNQRLNHWSTGHPPDLVRRKETGATVLDDGSLFVVGGEDPSGTSVGTATRFH